MKLSINLKLLLLYIYAFIVLYVPNLSYYIKINGVILFIGFTICYLIKYVFTKNRKFFSYFKKKYIFLFILFNILFTGYFFIRTAIAGVELLDFYNLRIFQNLIPVFVLIGVLIVYVELEELNYSNKDKYKFIINVALIQGLIALSMVIFPSLREIAYNIFYQGSNEINVYISASRLYGICDGNYTYSFQVMHSFLALFTLFYAYFYKEKKYYFYSLIVFTVTILNGRIGVVIFALGFLILLLYVLLKERKLFKFINIVVVGVILLILGSKIINTFIPNTAKLLNHAINDVLSFKEGNTTGYNETSHLISMIKFPESTVDKIFGSGYRIYAGYAKNFGYFETSDVGFVNDIFMGGIFYIILVYGSIALLVRGIFKNNNQTKFEKMFSLVLILSMCISNFKGELFRSQMQIAAVLFLLIFMLIKGEKDAKIFNNNSNI